MQHFKRSTSIKFTNPDFVKYAESFGLKGVHINKAEELAPALKKAISAGGIWIIDVPVDASENLRLTEMLAKKVCPP